MEIDNRILFGHKNEEILPIATTWMNLVGIVLSEISQTEKEKYCMISVICGIYYNQLVTITTKKEADPQIQRESSAYQWGKGQYRAGGLRGTNSYVSNKLQHTDWSPPGSSAHGIFQARILEWGAITFSRLLPDPGMEPKSLTSLALTGFFTTSVTGKAFREYNQYFTITENGINSLETVNHL